MTYSHITTLNPRSAKLPDGSFSTGDEINGADDEITVSASTPFPSDKFSSSGHNPFLIFFTLSQFIAYSTKV